MAREKLLKGKKKVWYPIIAPKLFNEQVIGEALAVEPESLIGKRIKPNAMTLTNDPKTSNINLIFTVDRVSEGRVLSKIIGLEMVTATIRRLVKKGKAKIDQSFSCKTLDNIDIIIKPVLITRSAAKGSILTVLRKTNIENVIKAVAKIEYMELVFNIITHKFQNSLKAQLKKVYPLRNFEIRVMKAVKGDIKEKVPEPPKPAEQEQPQEKKE